MSEPTSVVWFKRDLRLKDHEPLRLATERGRCICLYIYEPEIVSADDFDPAHLCFINDCLDELRANIHAAGGTLITRIGEATAVFEALRLEVPFDAIFSHQETGNAVSYARDLRVKRWAKHHNVCWTESAQHGVFRGLRDRDGWSRRWNTMMKEPLQRAPKQIVSPDGTLNEGRVDGERLGLEPVTKTMVQVAGEASAHETLRSFIHERGRHYQREMSSPNTAWNSCSRLSPHLAYGTLSIRTAHQAVRLRQNDIRARRRAKEKVQPGWLKSLASFDKRLHWHCHFIQKLESQPSLETRNMASIYDGLRENDFDAARFEAWRDGRTGYPMVDACMRQLQQTGWLNFRMRAMVVSFASYHLWLHWRPTGLYLARQFVDYEPGIHYSQLQMQSGTTGINAVRIYSPTKQVHDHDPDGTFIHRWVPELEGVPAAHIAEPSLMSADEQQRYGCVIGKDYPAPIVNHTEAVQLAKKRIYGLRKRPEARAEAKKVFERHGSRRGPASRARRKKKTAAATKR